MWRTAACQQLKDPLCPSIVRSTVGELLLLMTYVPENEPKAVLGLTRSSDDGRTWSAPVAVFTCPQGIPRALGTLTHLQSGRLIAPFHDEGAVRMLVSEDDGATWHASDPIDCAPLHDATPYSRIVEINGELLSPMFGHIVEAGRPAACSGLMRSNDGGKTWHDFSVIACDRSKGNVEYGPTAVYVSRSGPLLAMITVKDRFLYRSISTDAGHNWSVPEQRLVARNPALAPIGTTLVCVNQEPPATPHQPSRAIVRVQFSENLFDSWRCDRMLDQSIKGEYFSAVALDEDRLLLVHDRGRFKPEGRGTPVTGGIEVALMQRNPAAPSPPNKLIASTKRDQWELLKTFQIQMKSDFGDLTQAPDGTLYMSSAGRLYASTDDAMTFHQIAEMPHQGNVSILQSGRWIISACEWKIEDWNGKREHYIGADGYLYEKLTDVKGTNDLWTYYSDNRGKTWHKQPMDFQPLVWALPHKCFEDSDGTLIMPVYGCLSEEDTQGRVDCCGIFRSTDAGKTWGDFTSIAYDRQHKQIAYNELAIQPMPDGTWVAVIRTEWRNHHGGEAASSSTCFSRDHGRTWTKPQFAFIGAVPVLRLLPDGGLACATSLWKVRFSYDGGHTWSRELPSHTNHYPSMQVLGQDRLLLHDTGSDAKACKYRRIPCASRKSRTAEKSTT